MVLVWCAGITTTTPNSSAASDSTTITFTITSTANATEGYAGLDLTPAPVRNVVDGDTVDVFIEGREDRLRFIGIDTPETVDPREPVQCFGREASAKAKQLLEGQAVYLEADPSQGERDSFGRLLRYAWLADGRHFNELMVAEGYAHEYTYDLPYQRHALSLLARRSKVDATPRKRRNSEIPLRSVNEPNRITTINGPARTTTHATHTIGPAPRGIP